MQTAFNLHRLIHNLVLHCGRIFFCRKVLRVIRFRLYLTHQSSQILKYRLNVMGYHFIILILILNITDHRISGGLFARLAIQTPCLAFFGHL